LPLGAVVYQSPAETASPPARVARAARTRISRPACRKCTEPSANRKLAPPGWKAYGCRVLVQLMAHGPGTVAPSALDPATTTALALLAQGPPKENGPGT